MFSGGRESVHWEQMGYQINYSIYELMQPFLDWQLVNWLKLFVEYDAFLSDFKQKRIDLFCVICTFFSLMCMYHAEQAWSKWAWMRALHSILRVVLPLEIHFYGT